MDIESLFVYTMKDIEKRLTETDPYEILMIAGLLRKILLDGGSLVDQVNRARHLKIKFIVNDRPIPDDNSLIVWSIEDGLDPDTSPPSRCKPKEINEDQLLSTKVLKVGGTTYTIKDIISHIAHIEGAVHAGVTKEEKDAILKKFVQEYQIGGVPATLRLLKAIARVIVKGLKPLELLIIR